MRKHPILVGLGKRIRELRIERGWSQENFANECGLDRSYYGGVERGERNVAAINLAKVAEVLGVRVGDLFPD
ncbi:helix-turn-helix transcriptional regulator [Hydrocarboniphaga effusa]|jgi:transcriptional regulator with XRE-family HTH domain|uniref:helix-turn-helix domain-containing protein n=1 Tax=Hydrocarboniphaga effusa TaxID=243629 RepID=UPI003137EEEF